MWLWTSGGTSWPEGTGDGFGVLDRAAHDHANRDRKRHRCGAASTHRIAGYDWRTFEKRFAALPHFVTRIDGVDIHFIHVRSKHEDALPLIVTHGWPGSTIEQLKIIGPLTDPTAHGADAADAFHLVIPSLPGHGFSGKPTETGWDPIRDRATRGSC